MDCSCYRGASSQMAHFGEDDCQEDYEIQMELHVECDSCGKPPNEPELLEKFDEYEDVQMRDVSVYPTEDLQVYDEKKNTHIIRIGGAEDGDDKEDQQTAIVKTCKSVISVVIMLIMKAVEGGFDVKLEKVWTDSNHFCGVSLTFRNGGRNDTPTYFIYYKNDLHFLDHIHRLSSKLKGALLNVVTFPKCPDLEMELRRESSRYDVLNAPTTVPSKIRMENVAFCNFEENDPTERTLDAVVRLYGKRGEKGNGEEEMGKRESEMVSQYLKSEIEEFFVSGGKETEFVLKRSDLDREIRKKLFGSVSFGRRKSAPKHVGGLQILHKLRDLLRGGSKNTVVICGAVGVGKSELAVKYAEEFGIHYDNVVWIDSRSPKTAESSFLELARDELRILLEGTDGKEKDARTVVNDVYHFFRNKRTLFVFDDARNRDCVILPDSVFQCKPHVIITSRYRNWGETAVMEVEPFREEDARDLLGKAVFSTCKAVAKEVEYNPWLLTKFNKEVGDEEARMSKIKEVMSYMIRLAEALSKSLGRGLILTERDRTVLDHTLDNLEREPCGEASTKILKKLVYCKESYVPTVDILKWSKDFDQACEVINSLVENSLVEIVDERIKIHTVVKLVLLWKWTTE